MSNVINWVEIPVTDFDRASKFYGNILNADLQGQDWDGYQMAFFPSEQGSVGGAIVKGEGYQPSTTGPLVYLNGGEDLNGILSKVESAGGQVIMPKTQISPEYGHMARFLDSEGNMIALHSQN